MENGLLEIERFKANLQIEVKRFEADLVAKQAVWSETATREREVWKHELQTSYVMFNAIVEFALITIRSLVLANGAAIIGIIGFTGNIWSKGGDAGAEVARAIAPAITWFATGLSFALITAGMAYLSQIAYAELKRPRPALVVGNVIRSVAVVCALISLGAFVYGAHLSIAAFASPISR